MGIHRVPSTAAIAYNTIKNEKRIADYAVAKPGMQTSDNDRFLKLWYEVPNNNIGFGMSHEDATFSRYKWFPYNKGGRYRKWYGNNEYIVNYQYDGKEVKVPSFDKSIWNKACDIYIWKFLNDISQILKFLRTWFGVLDHIKTQLAL